MLDDVVADGVPNLDRVLKTIGTLTAGVTCGAWSPSTIGRFPAGPPHVPLMKNLKVWFDGGCPLCRREIALMRRLDREQAIDFVDVASAESDCPIDRADLLARFHALEDGHLVSGAAAFAAMWRAIPLLRPLGRAARNPRVLSGLERLYIGFLRLRPWLQRFAFRFEPGKAAA